ncbi:MAG: 2-keto-4-pentenoate hydratase [Actinomycetales bacterium]
MDAAQIAQTLREAESTRTELKPFSDDNPDIDLATAYDAQWLNVQAKLDSGDSVVGAKLGLTSRVKQKVMNVDDPLYGWVTSSMILEHDEPVDLSRFIHPRVEPEIGFLLGKDITTPANVASVLASTEAVFAAIDVLDSRYADFRFTLPDVAADNASAAGFYIGPKMVSPKNVDLGLVGAVFRVDGEVAATAAGAATMGHPAAAVAWLANRLVQRGRKLEAGMIVFSGGLTAPFPVTPGGSYSAELDGMGTIEIRGSAG